MPRRTHAAAAAAMGLSDLGGVLAAVGRLGCVAAAGRAGTGCANVPVGRHLGAGAAA